MAFAILEDNDRYPTVVGAGNERVGKQAALAIGSGDATGGAIAKRFAREGMVACVARRSADKLQPLVE
jgi:NADP-dependent 3-hydroxy acid dehydrogenase YdfG